jgi:hypothetical protein
LAGVFALAALTPLAARGQSHGGLEGTWASSGDGPTVQIIVAGGSVIGFYWRGDYIDTKDATVSGDGRSVSFAFNGGGATLTRTGEKTASVTITDHGNVTHEILNRD